MKLARFKENDSRKTFLIVFTVVSILLLALAFFYNSYAVYQDVKSFDILTGTIPDIGEALYIYHLPDGVVTTLATNVDSSLILDENQSSCNYGVVPKNSNGVISLDKTNANNMVSQKIRCDLYMMELPAITTLKKLAALNPSYQYTSNSSACLSVNDEGMILNPNSTMSDSDTPVICAMEDDYGTSYYLRGNHTSNYVKFANSCWKIVRITGSGGLKLIYNGDLDENGKCTTPSTEHLGFVETTIALGGLARTYGNSYTFDGTNYTLNDTSSLRWSSDASSTIGKYTCGNRSSTCTTLYYVIDKYDSSSGLVLTLDQNVNYASIGVNAYNYRAALSNVGYMYNDSYLSQHNSSISDDETHNFYYGESFTYTEGAQRPYSLVNTVQFSNMSSSSNKELLNTHHYTCFYNENNTCDKLYYIYYLLGTTPYYIELQGNENGYDAIDKMVNNDNINVNSSDVKKAIDFWYKTNIDNSEYEEFIEDSVFCNDRTIDDMGGWSNTGTLTNFLRFNGVQEKYYLKCPHKRDAFTVNDNVKGNASLTYPIGLLTSAESSLQGNYTVQKTDNEYWTLTPAAYGNDVVEMKSIKEAGNWEQSSFSYYALGVRPSISLKASVNFKSGTNGSKENPYEIIVNENS